MFCGVCNACGNILALRFTYNIKAYCAQCNLHWVRYVYNIVYRVGCHILLCVAGETVYHGEIALVYTLGRYWEETFGTVGNILIGIFGRLVVGVGIDTEHREVTGVAWPYPVVGITTELAY